MKLLVTSYMQEEYVEEFKKMFDEIKFVGMMQIDRILTEDELIQEIADADAIVVEFDPLTRKVLESAKKLKVIASVRGGAHANVDVAAAIVFGIPILYVPGRNQDTVDDFTIGMMVAISRGLAKGHHLIKNRIITDDKTYVENGFALPMLTGWALRGEVCISGSIKGPRSQERRWVLRDMARSAGDSQACAGIWHEGHCL